MSPDTVRMASPAVRSIIIALSVTWEVVLAWLPGRWILRQWRLRDGSE